MGDGAAAGWAVGSTRGENEDDPAVAEAPPAGRNEFVGACGAGGFAGACAGTAEAGRNALGVAAGTAVAVDSGVAGSQPAARAGVAGGTTVGPTARCGAGVTGCCTGPQAEAPECGAPFQVEAISEDAHPAAGGSCRAADGAEAGPPAELREVARVRMFAGS